MLWNRQQRRAQPFIRGLSWQQDSSESLAWSYYRLSRTESACSRNPVKVRYSPVRYSSTRMICCKQHRNATMPCHCQSGKAFFQLHQKRGIRRDQYKSSFQDSIIKSNVLTLIERRVCNLFLFYLLRCTYCQLCNFGLSWGGCRQSFLHGSLH